MISVEDLSKFYYGQRAIEDVSFNIKQGEIVGLLGLNGAGKSTILKILGCFLMPSAGRATIDGHSIEDNPHAIRSIIGYLPDTPPLYNEMTVYKYLVYVARLKGVVSDHVAKMVDDAISKTSLSDVRDVALGNLSHGFRQRVGIAQAIVHKPKVLIFDEPINGLDPIQIVEMRDLILTLRQQHTVILSSHILSEITKTCDRIVIVDKGVIIAEGNEKELRSRATSAQGVRCLVQKTAGLAEKLKKVAGVKEVTITESNPPRVDVVMSTDVRTSISQAIVESGSGLLEMHQSGDGLEDLFLEFVRSN